jgi:hypothetical protein
MHFREPDGTISTKRTAETTVEDWERHLAEMQAEVRRQSEAIEKCRRGEITHEELDRIFDEWELLYGNASWEHQ